MVTDDTLWEIKCVTKLTDEHKNQLLVYAWLHLKKENGTTNKTFKILNVYDGELWELKAETEEKRKGIYSAVKALIKHYFDKDSKRVSDAEFVDICCEQVLVANFPFYYFLTSSGSIELPIRHFLLSLISSTTPSFTISRIHTLGTAFCVGPSL